MLLSDEEIEFIVSRQEKQLREELAAIEKIKRQEKHEQSASLKLAYKIRDNLKIQFGAASALSFWMLEIREMGKDVANPRNRERLLQLSKLIKMSGGGRALNFALAQFPENTQEFLNELWAGLENWSLRN